MFWKQRNCFPLSTRNKLFCFLIIFIIRLNFVIQQSWLLILRETNRFFSWNYSLGYLLLANNVSTQRCWFKLFCLTSCHNHWLLLHNIVVIRSHILRHPYLHVGCLRHHINYGLHIWIGLVLLSWCTSIDNHIWLLKWLVRSDFTVLIRVNRVPVWRLQLIWRYLIFLWLRWMNVYCLYWTLLCRGPFILLWISLIISLRCCYNYWLRSIIISRLDLKFLLCRIIILKNLFWLLLISQ